MAPTALIRSLSLRASLCGWGYTFGLICFLLLYKFLQRLRLSNKNINNLWAHVRLKEMKEEERRGEEWKDGRKRGKKKKVTNDLDFIVWLKT